MVVAHDIHRLLEGVDLGKSQMRELNNPAGIAGVPDILVNTPDQDTVADQSDTWVDPYSSLGNLLGNLYHNSAVVVLEVVVLPPVAHLTPVVVVVAGSLYVGPFSAVVAGFHSSQSCPVDQLSLDTWPSTDRTFSHQVEISSLDGRLPSCFYWP